ncbi:MAG: phytanoyl-CoA dioxygenase family protein [Crocosphaera sp.]|uniref:phytanoyl-CoA dioxygenase family protein n=1 Tax=Crocosphaera sp. TaxID=2729996 RepID=UPI0025852686|nr:phytanoyl-CoA dioxygenase family protein [Crocosphaera sp.]MCH2247662.1 phytanoyl-CoA dioxygenase family protein [Crocosphaera sp.]
MTLESLGYQIIEDCFSVTDCEKINLQLQDINLVGTRCLLQYKWCQTLARNLKKRLLNHYPDLEKLITIQCTYFNKSLSHNWFVAFHQDRSIPMSKSVAAHWPGWSQKEGMTFIQGTDNILKNMIAVRVHLDDCTDVNGCLSVIPSSHLYGTLNPEKINQLKTSISEHQLLVSKGDCIIMRPLLLHASSKSSTLLSRRVLHFLFGPATLPQGLEWPEIIEI